MIDRRLIKVKKLLDLAGDNPKTPEEITAYSKAKKILTAVEREKRNSNPKLLYSSKGTKTDGFFKKTTDGIKDILNIPRTIPWDKFFKYESDPYNIFEIQPTSSVRNNQTYVLAKVIASFYRKPRELRKWFKDGVLFTKKSPYRFNFRIIMKDRKIGFYLLLPKDRTSEILRKIEGIYDSGITINQIQELPRLVPEKCFCTELHYRNHDIFSLDTDRTNNYPLPSLLTAVRTLEGEDIAIFDAMLEAGKRGEWLKTAKEAHNLLEKGFIPEIGVGGKIFTAIQQTFYKLRDEIIEVSRLTKHQKEEFEKWKKDQSSCKEAKRIRNEMTNSTRRKQDGEILNAFIRIAVQSDDPIRRKTAAYTIANSWKDLSADNELDRFDIPKKVTSRYIKGIEERKALSIKFRPLKVSPEEAGKLIQLPGDSLIKEFPEVNAKLLKDVSVPDELIQENIKGVRIGVVTERGIKKLIRIPLEAYGKVKLKHVYDALCTSSFGQGKQGTGKSEGYGTTWAYDMVANGFSVILIDTADGQVLRNFINSLPEDFPDKEKIHAINIDNKAWPVALNWSDVYGRTFANGDAELQALEISERITDRFVKFINSLSNTGEFTDRMAQYVNSCMRAITKKKVWSFLDLELALTSPSYRKELLQLKEVQEMPEVVDDLRTLQDKAIENKTGSIVDPILSRIRSLAGTQFMANLFYQEPKLNESSEPILDIRKLMDNEDGGYGHVVAIQASGDAWNDNQSTILGFMVDKINFNAFSRIDIDQEGRKPCLVWIDEPHKVIKSMEGRLAGTSVEFRKYRVKNLFTGHSIDQMGSAANALLDGGAQITSYKTERLNQFTRFGHKFKPYDNAKELYENLAEKWQAINSVRLPSGKPCPAFIADMVPPPKFVKDREYIWQASAEKYGRHWKEVKKAIHEKRNKYKALDYEWHTNKNEEILQKKAEDSAKLKEAKKKAMEAVNS